jgi:myo-inositol-1(or 4)-monophosphatase
MLGIKWTDQQPLNQINKLTYKYILKIISNAFENKITADYISNVLINATKRFHELFQTSKSSYVKNDGTLVTNVDLEVNSFLKNLLIDSNKSIGWLSEEDDYSINYESLKYIWVIDPLDGTKEFVRDIPEYAISIGLVKEGKIIAGGVVNPQTRFVAAAGIDGSFKVINKPIETNNFIHAGYQKKNISMKISISRTEIEDGTININNTSNYSLIPIGSVANKLLRVACGLEDLTFSLQPKSIWDICGGVALLNNRKMLFELLDNSKNILNFPETRIYSGFVAGPSNFVKIIKKQINEGLFI